MACDTIKIETLDADEVVSIVTQGPQGPSGAEAATLTTTGDLLYRAALANDRLPIGSEGQVLKVASGLPAWGNESGAVTSVNGETGAVVLDAADVGAAPATGIDPTAITGTAVVDNDARLSDSRTPTAHAASHASAGSDPLAPGDIGAQSIFVTQNLALTSNTTLTAARAKVYYLAIVTGNTNYDVLLPQSDNQAGDLVIIRNGFFAGNSYATIKSDAFTELGQIGLIDGRIYRFIYTGTSWDLDPAPYSFINLSDPDRFVGTLDIARIPTGTSSSTVCIGDDARLSDARTPTSHTHGNLTNDGKIGSTAGLPLKTGTAGVVEAGAFGTGAGEFAEGNHTHTQLHDRSHAISSTSDHTAGNHKVFYSNGSGEIVELALGNSGEVLTSNGATSAPSFAAASGGGVTGAAASASDVLGVSGSDITGVDAGSDKIVFWDDSASELTYLATVGPTFDGTTLRWPVELIIACSDETTDLTTGTAKVTFRAPYAFLLTGVRASVNTAPTGSTLIVDINNGANSALSTKLSIDATEKTSATAATAAVIDTTYDDFSDDAEITIDIDQIGSTIAGKGLKVTLIGTRA